MAFIPMSGNNVRRVVIGTSNSQERRTFNIANVLPTEYKNLTLDNFAICNALVGWGSGSFSSQAYENIPLSYNASTGVLTCGKDASNGSGYKFWIAYTVVCYY